MKFSTLKQLLVKIVKKDLKQSTTGIYRRNFKCYLPEYLLDDSDYQAILKLVYESEEIKRTVTYSLFLLKINTFIEKILNKEGESRDINILIDDLKQMLSQLKKFTVYVPIKGLRLNSITIPIYDYIKVVEPQAVAPYKKYDEADICLLELEVNACDFEKAMEIGADIAQIFINFIRYVDCQTWNEEELNINLLGIEAHGHGVYIHAMEKGDIGLFSSRLIEGKNLSYDIDEDTIKDLFDCGLEDFGELLHKRLNFSENEIETKVIRALEWFGQSRLELEAPSRFLKLMLAVESLVQTNSVDPITLTLSERVAFILKTDIEGRISLFSDMKKLYAARSKVVHHGSSNINYDELYSLENIVCDLIKAFLIEDNWSSKSNTEELEQYFTKLKFNTGIALTL
ncbi:HEPN domain-containing protein [Peribacillus sp. TH24]|uniref:HEPN domain-containing protein n=1 Tax=Peribacillus sp. TH24 TaxID=2798483 RepID=UPI0019125FDE|nr:HEPN domain-containing protein [Peribacillus sp. TH24]MBK5447047.1 hypothetical protein [Peribacillus sp. TH24]MBK5447078.1 hypothetical protein [Peribacillus sp. TH24]